MPIHDFQCRKCGKRAELLVRGGEEPRCPACGSDRLERLFSPTAAVSTAATRQKSLAGARSRAQAVKREKDAAHSEYMRNHIKDHS